MATQPTQSSSTVNPTPAITNIARAAYAGGKPYNPNYNFDPSNQRSQHALHNVACYTASLEDPSPQQSGNQPGTEFLRLFDLEITQHENSNSCHVDGPFEAHAQVPVATSSRKTKQADRKCSLDRQTMKKFGAPGSHSAPRTESVVSSTEQKCRHCEDTFADFQTHQNHLQLEHFSCIWCKNETFTTAQEISDHLEKEHSFCCYLPIENTDGDSRLVYFWFKTAEDTSEHQNNYHCCQTKDCDMKGRFMEDILEQRNHGIQTHYTCVLCLANPAALTPLKARSTGTKKGTTNSKIFWHSLERGLLPHIATHLAPYVDGQRYPPQCFNGHFRTLRCSRSTDEKRDFEDTHIEAPHVLDEVAWLFERLKQLVKKKPDPKTFFVESTKLLMVSGSSQSRHLKKYDFLDHTNNLHLDKGYLYRVPTRKDQEQQDAERMLDVYVRYWGEDAMHHLERSIAQRKEKTTSGAVNDTTASYLYHNIAGSSALSATRSTFHPASSSTLELFSWPQTEALPDEYNDILEHGLTDQPVWPTESPPELSQLSNPPPPVSYGESLEQVGSTFSRQTSPKPRSKRHRQS